MYTTQVELSHTYESACILHADWLHFSHVKKLYGKLVEHTRTAFFMGEGMNRESFQHVILTKPNNMKRYIPQLLFVMKNMKVNCWYQES